MKYPSLGKSRQYRVTIPQLNGGVNYAVPPHLIEDNQLSDVLNVWYKDGRLQTRKALSVLDMGHGNQMWFCLKNSCVVGDYIFTYEFSKNALSFRMFYQPQISLELGARTYTFAEGTPDIVSVLPVEVNYNSSEDLSKFNVVLIIGKADGTTSLLGVGVNHEFYSYVVEEVAPYVPTVLQSGIPQVEMKRAVNGVMLEPYNLLSNKYTCKYTTNGEGAYYYIPETETEMLPAGESVVVTYTDKNGTTYEHRATQYIEDFGKYGDVYREKEANEDLYTLVYSRTFGMFYFESRIPSGSEQTAAVLPLSSIANNVQITIYKKGNPSLISGMRFSTWYGGGASGLSGGTRLFVSGNEKQPNLVNWSGLNNPLYFPENNYSYVGWSTEAVTAFGKQGEMLVIFKDSEVYYTQYYQGATITESDVTNQTVIDIEATQAQFPIIPIHPTVGCDCPSTIQLCNNRLVWLNTDGKVYGLFSAGQYSERNVRELSYCVETKLKKHSAKEFTKASAAETENHYLLMIGSTIYAMDYSSSGFSYYGSYSSDSKAQKAVTWNVWDVSNSGVFYGTEDRVAPKLLNVNQDIIMIGEAPNKSTVLFSFAYKADDDSVSGTSDSVSVLQKPIACMFKTKLFDFGYPERLKRINPFYLQVSGESGKTLNLTYLNGNGGTADVYSPALDGEDLETTTPKRITPNVVRAREFGLIVESEGKIEVGSLTLNYSMMGTVR